MVPLDVNEKARRGSGRVGNRPRAVNDATKLWIWTVELLRCIHAVHLPWTAGAVGKQLAA